MTEPTQASDALLYEKREHILVLTLNRPQAKNAFNAELSNALSDALDRYEEDSELRVCVLTDKIERRQVDVAVDYVGFTIPNVFVVGYGFDHDGLYRNLPYVAVLDGA